jgi:hypothetical protein
MRKLMVIYTKETLKRLSNLDLIKYAGDLKAIKGQDAILYDELMNTPVEAKVIAKEGICEDVLYKICLDAQMNYEGFKNLRHNIINKLSKSEQLTAGTKNLLTVLFNGVYIGEPEDILNYRKGGATLYPTKGLGKRIMDVQFSDVKEIIPED